MSKKEDDLIIVLLKEVREDQKDHSIILVELQNDVSRNTNDLETHIEGVMQNRSRIEKLEEPGKAFKILKKYLMGIAAITGSILAIMKFKDYL